MSFKLASELAQEMIDTLNHIQIEYPAKTVIYPADKKSSSRLEYHNPRECPQCYTGRLSQRRTQNGARPYLKCSKCNYFKWGQLNV